MAKKIHIKKENKGKFNATKKSTGKSTEELTHSKNPVTKKRAIFAQNASHWNKAQGGVTMPNELDYPNDVEGYHAALEQYMASVGNFTPMTPSAPQAGYTDKTGTRYNIPPNFLSNSNYGGNPEIRPISLQEKFDKANQFPSVEQSFQQAGRDLSKPTKYGPQNKKNFNWGNAALTAMLAFDALIPGEPIKKPVVRPLQSYNPHPYGTNSQALAEDGITLSTTGYKANSKDKNKSKLRIPSNQITMENVPHNVLGIDSLGNQQLMTPGNNYQFPGEYVDEFPMAKKGKKLKKPKMGQYVSKSYEEGGELEYQKGGSLQPIITSNPNDPRLRAYQDSAKLYNNYLDVKQKLEDSGYTKGAGITGYDDRVKKALASKKLFGLRQEDTDMYSVDDLVPWQINQNLGRQLISTKIKPKDIENYSGTSSDKNMLSWKSNLKGSGNKSRYSDDGDYYLNTKENRVTDLRSIANYSNVNPIQPYAYRPEQPKPISKKPIEKPTRQPITAPISNPTSTYPNIEIGQPNPQAPSFKQAAWDNTQPSNYNFTYPTFEGGNSQKTINFPDEGTWKNFIKGVRGADSQQTPGHGTATGYMKGGGKIPKNVKIHDKSMTKKQRKFFQDICDMENGGKMLAANGLQIEDNQFTPISDSTLKIGGNSHAHGGTDLMYGNKGVEAEAGETFHIDQEGNGIIMGNMKNPLTGNKFKNDSKILAKKEKKLDKILDYSTELVNKSNPYDKWDSLKFNAGEAMMTGANIKKKELAESRQHLSSLQEAMLDLNREGGHTTKGKKEAKYGAKNGLRIDSTEKAQMGMTMAMKKGKNDELRKMYDIERKNKQTNALNMSFDEWSKYTTEHFQGSKPDGVDKPFDFNTTEGLKRYVDWTKYIFDEPLQPVDNQANSAIPTEGNLSVAQRHNNPGNMKYESWMSKFGATPGGSDNITKDGTTYAQFPDTQTGMTALKEKLLHRPTYSKLTLKQAISKWTGNHPYANIPSDIGDKVLSQMTPEEQERAVSVITSGEDSKVYNRTQPGGTPTKPLEGQTYIPENVHFNPLQAPQFGTQPEKQKGGPNAPYQYNWNLNETPEIPVGTDAEGLQFQQILPELYAAATNKEEPVWMQKYNPQLFQDHEVSFQDRRNQITSQGRASRQYLGDNAGAQAILAAGEYDAINNIGADEFRVNQQISNDITNKNIALLNDASLKNLQLGDLQYTRQATAKSKTKKVDMDVLSSVSDKVLQNRLENRTLQVYENLYPHYRYNDQYQLKKEGNPGSDYLSLPSFNQQPSIGDNTAVQKWFDRDGNIKTTKTSEPSKIKTASDKLKLGRENMQKIWNSKKDLFGG